MASSNLAAPGIKDFSCCAVCSDAASYDHHGVMICEACKVQFYKGVTEALRSPCKNNGLCHISPTTRTACQLCHFKKCVQVGLSKEGTLDQAAGLPSPGRLPSPSGLPSPALLSSTGSVSASSTDETSQRTYCAVCSDEASGFHYGVNACEGCKGFFRRCITQGVTHPCANNEKCQITPFTRNSCQHCRLKKCFLVGMSREASRLGRRPKRSKTADKEDMAVISVEELQKIMSSADNGQVVVPRKLIEAMQSKKSPPTPVVAKSPVSLHSSVIELYQSCQEPPAKHLRQDSVGQDCGSASSVDSAPVFYPQSSPSFSPSGKKIRDMLQLSSVLRTDHDTSTSPTSHGNISSQNSDSCTPPLSNPVQPDFESSPTSAEVKLEQSGKLSFTDLATIIDPMADSQSRTKWTERYHMLLQKAKEPIPSHQKDWVEKCTAEVVGAHMKTCYHTVPKFNAKLERFHQLMASDPNKSKMMAQKMAQAEPTEMWHMIVKGMVPVIQRVVSFSKHIPGFYELEQNNQVMLVKHGSFAVILLRYCRLFEADGMFNPDMDIKIDRDKLSLMPLGQFFLEQQAFSDEFNKLGLTDEVIGLCTALCILEPNRPGLTQIQQILDLQIFYSKCLYRYLQQLKCGEAAELLEKVFMNLIELEIVNEHHAAYMQNVSLDLPDLHKETFSNFKKP